MFSCELWNWIIIHFNFLINSQFLCRFESGFCFDGLSDCNFSSDLADFCQISSGEAISHLGKSIKVNIWSNWSLSGYCLKDRNPSLKIRKRNITKGIKSSWTKQGLIKNERSICSTNEENILLLSYTIHLSKNLIHNSISGTTSTDTLTS